MIKIITHEVIIFIFIVSIVVISTFFIQGLFYIYQKNAQILKDDYENILWSVISV